MSTNCAKCRKPIECDPSGDCWCKHLPGERVTNFAGCMCVHCLTGYENYAHRFEAIQRILVKRFEEMGFEPDEDYDAMWRVEIGGTVLNITAMSAELNEALGLPKAPPRDPQARD